MRLKFLKFPRSGMKQLMVRAGARFIKFNEIGDISEDLGDHAAATVMANWRGCFEIYHEPKKRPRSGKGFLKADEAPLNKMASSPENK